jgi:hypothetical protein
MGLFGKKKDEEKPSAAAAAEAALRRIWPRPRPPRLRRE